jgi:DNA-binding Xre family transcriptional regulator
MLRFRIKELIARWEIENRRPLSLEDLAEHTKISKQVLSKMGDYRGYVTASRHIEEVCHFFKVMPNDLIVFDCDLGTPRDERPKQDDAGISEDAE